MVAAASGQQGDALIRSAVQTAAARTGYQELTWLSDGWQSYPTILRQTYRRPHFTSRSGRPRFVLPEGLTLTQTIKARRRRARRPRAGRPRRPCQHTPFGTAPPDPVPVHIERFNGVLRDRVACLGRRTHAFAKCVGTWRALVGLTLFWHNWLKPHPALRTPTTTPGTPSGRRYDQRSPAMAVGLTDHIWTWDELFSIRITISR